MPKQSVQKQSEIERRLALVEHTIGVRFKNRTLLQEALTHRSFHNEKEGRGFKDYERLEFFGDAVLEYVVCGYLYRQKPEISEGAMTSLKSALVSGKALGQLGEELGLGKYIFMSRGKRADFSEGNKARVYIIACAVEAIIGAIELDRGIGTSELFVLEFILPRLNQIIATGGHIDPKSHFQNLAQERFGVDPTYTVLLEQGSGEDRIFAMATWIGKQQIAVGSGSSKKLAETEAARQALQKEFGVTLPAE